MSVENSNVWTKCGNLEISRSIEQGIMDYCDRCGSHYVEVECPGCK